MEKPGEISESDSFVQSSGCLHDVRWIFESQERNVPGCSFGVTLLRTKEGQIETQSRDGEHTCTSKSSRCGKSG
jgi:hypothetical protein